MASSEPQNPPKPPQPKLLPKLFPIVLEHYLNQHYDKIQKNLDPAIFDDTQERVEASLKNPHDDESAIGQSVKVQRSLASQAVMLRQALDVHARDLHLQEYCQALKDVTSVSNAIWSQTRRIFLQHLENARSIRDNSNELLFQHTRGCGGVDLKCLRCYVLLIRVERACEICRHLMKMDHAMALCLAMQKPMIRLWLTDS